MQLDVFAVSIIFWIVLVVLLVWVTRSIRSLEVRLKNVEERKEKHDED
jgi:hypothetical protein